MVDNGKTKSTHIHHLQIVGQVTEVDTLYFNIGAR